MVAAPLVFELSLPSIASPKDSGGHELFVRHRYFSIRFARRGSVPGKTGAPAEEETILQLQFELRKCAAN